MNDVIKILILGGYGTFGGRLAQLLCDEPRLQLVLAGRSLQKAQYYCGKLQGRATLEAREFDRNGDLATQLDDVMPHILVDASGPFQIYGEAPYRVVEACLDKGIHYLDLADGTGFVRGITAYDERARQAGLFVLSGVSSFPVLTAAATRALQKGMQEVLEITAGIAPSPYADVGLNVIRAIASYAGKPVAVIRNGQPSTTAPFTESRTHVVAPPGMLPLRMVRFSLVDVPDLQALPELWPQARNVWMGAGPVPPVLHLALRFMARLVRLRLLPSLLPFAGLMHKAINVLSWGEHRGGMFIEVTGTSDAGEPVTHSWHMLAEGDDGPLIPSMAAAAIIHRHLNGNSPAAGARACVQDVELEDYKRLFLKQTIYTGMRIPDRLPESATLYRRILGSAWNHLPPAIQAMHDLNGSMKASGTAQIHRGKGLLATVVATLFRFPPSGADVPVSVSFTEQEGKELWKRQFASHGFSSVQFAGSGRFDRLLCERFGPFVFGLALVVKNSRLNLVTRRWTFLGIPLPLFLAPNGKAYETGEQARFHFHVEIKAPGVGLIVRYTGWLKPELGSQ